MTAKLNEQPLIIECAYEDTLGGDKHLETYNGMLRGNQAKNPNERPDKDAPSDDPLVS